jgi:hypothetical protein
LGVAVGVTGSAARAEPTMAATVNIAVNATAPVRFFIV